MRKRKRKRGRENCGSELLVSRTFSLFISPDAARFLDPVHVCFHSPRWTSHFTRSPRLSAHAADPRRRMHLVAPCPSPFDDSEVHSCTPCWRSDDHFLVAVLGDIALGGSLGSLFAAGGRPSKNKGVIGMTGTTFDIIATCGQARAGRCARRRPSMHRFRGSCHKKNRANVHAIYCMHAVYWLLLP